uniref:Uncharacterized protein n=2 Tax=unclassified Caudoviricetes TaxID=2788787 RepID=A0A8S5UMU0_9CAUD|nr:MAG TPA: hypothetical protein [Siphoviridae sp. ctsus30]DAF95800.1 MAG TPA: hypothetical protein [Siphoviridae sp. ctKGQ3]
MLILMRVRSTTMMSKSVSDRSLVLVSSATMVSSVRLVIRQSDQLAD